MGSSNLCPPSDFCRCVSDILSRCEKDGPVPKAKPRDVSDFSLYAPVTKLCRSSPYKRPRLRAPAFTGLAPFASVLQL